jgi:hypothetical protein
MRDLANYQVKDLSQFMDRFNYNEHLLFKKDSTPNRYKNLISLLNLKDTSFRSNPKTTSFLKFVCNEKSNIKLNYKDDKWFAIAHCSFIYHGKEKSVNLILKLDNINNDRFYWVIHDVQSDLFQFPKNDKRNSLFINPMNHEVGFTELSRALSKKSDIVAYTSSGNISDELSAFLLYVKNGDLQFKQINAIDFDFLQIEGWFFKVKDFFRVSYNSGWLISSIKKMTNEEKDAFMKNHFIE